jgi:hypothetical protein
MPGDRLARRDLSLRHRAQRALKGCLRTIVGCLWLCRRLDRGVAVVRFSWRRLLTRRTTCSLSCEIVLNAFYCCYCCLS